MKLKKQSLLKLAPVQEVKEEPAPKKKSTGKPLPEDSYSDEFEPFEVVIDETKKFVFSVKRQGDLGLLRVDVRLFETTERHTGWTKKGVNFPIENLFEMTDTLREVYDKCIENELIDEE